MKRHAALSRAFTNVFDKAGTLTAQSLSKAHRDPLRRVGRGVLVAIGIALCIMPNAGSAIPMQPKEYIDYKTYSFYLLDWDKRQHKCLLKLYGKESAWNPKARNNSHYGIPQGRSIYLSKVDGYKQIQWGLKYIHHRYDGDTCKALSHWETHNWH